MANGTTVAVKQVMNNLVTPPLSYAVDCDHIGCHTTYATGGGENARFKYPGIPIQTGLKGFNEFGLPMHACNGHINDAHYWSYVKHANSLIKN